MSEAVFRSERGIYVHEVVAEYVEARLMAYPEFLGERQQYTLALSPVRGGWILVGVPDDIVQGDFYNLALWLLGGEEEEGVVEDEEDEDLPPLGELPPEAVLAVSHVPGDPERCYYAHYKGGDEMEFIGRRDDGKGLRVDVLEDEVKVVKGSKHFSLGVLDYLKERGVPEELRPGPGGFAFVPARRIAVDTNLA